MSAGTVLNHLYDSDLCRDGPQESRKGRLYRRDRLSGRAKNPSRKPLLGRFGESGMMRLNRGRRWSRREVAETWA
jgi:hypothetical protein